MQSQHVIIQNLFKQRRKKTELSCIQYEAYRFENEQEKLIWK